MQATDDVGELGFWIKRSKCPGITCHYEEAGMCKDIADYDCVGVGVGPANLSLASLLYPHREISNLFLEKRKSFGWHDGQLIPDTTLQVSILKDLVSLADPTSEFSFLAYLHENGRVYHFINAQFDAVPRQEYRNYLEWASRKNENIVFGEAVESVTFDRVFRLHTSNRTITANNISIAIGYQPRIPEMVSEHLGPTQFHVSEFIERTEALGGKRVCVIGGGQSGAEAFLDLISRQNKERPQRVSWISRRRNFYPIDDSPFTNDAYTPGYSKYFYGLEPGIRQLVNEQQILTSDGISEDTLRRIYQRIYTLRFIHDTVDEVALYPNCDVTAVTARAGEWEVTLANSDQPGVLGQVEADVVIWASGYRAASLDLLAPIAHRLAWANDEYEINQDFTVRWDGPDNRNIFLQNAALQQRGLADKNLSLIAWRSQRIVDRLRGSRGAEPKPSFVEWSGKVPSGEAPVM